MIIGILILCQVKYSNSSFYCFFFLVSQEQVKEKKICFLTLAPDDSTVSFAEYKGVLPPLFKPERRFRKFYCLKLNHDAQVSGR